MKAPKAAPARPAAAPAAGAKPATKPGYGILWLAITFVLVVIFSLPTVILLFFGMLPTVVAVVIDRTPNRYSAYCVGGFNFAGVFPYLMDLWIQSHEIAYAFGIVTNVFKLFVMYGAASFGWMVFIGVPPVVGTFLEVLSQRRVAELKDIQKKLAVEWGPEVSATTNAKAEEAAAAAAGGAPPQPVRPSPTLRTMAPPTRA